MSADVSVLIATCRRAELLELALGSLARSTLPPDRFEVIVADNADDPATREACARAGAALPVRYAAAPGGGKNAALNQALPLARGELLVFSDDDIDAAPDWLAETRAGAERWPDHVLFGGRVLPAWPGPFPAHLRESRYLGVCFSVLDKDLVEGPHPAFNPFGPNMAVRRVIFDRGVRFNEQVGPRQGLYIMGSETDLIRRLKAMGHEAVYLPRSVVRHRIRPEQLSPRWLLSRGFRYGRKLAYEQEHRTRPAKAWAGVPRWLYRTLAQQGLRAGAALLRPNPGRRLDEALDLSVSLGMFYQYRHSMGAQSRS